MFDSTESLKETEGPSEPSEVEGGEAKSSQHENSGNNEDSQPPEKPLISVTVNGQDEPEVAHVSNSEPSPPSFSASNGETTATGDGRLDFTNKENQSNVSGIFIECVFHL